MERPSPGTWERVLPLRAVEEAAGVLQDLLCRLEGSSMRSVSLPQKVRKWGEGAAGAGFSMQRRLEMKFPHPRVKLGDSPRRTGAKCIGGKFPGIDNNEGSVGPRFQGTGQCPGQAGCWA